MSKNIQLTSAHNYNISRMVFSDPVSGSIPDSAVSFKRIPISTMYEDGKKGDLIIPTELCFSLGFKENINKKTGEIEGYVFPLSLFSRDGATKAEEEWVNTFNNIVEHVKDYLIENREELELYDLERADLKKLNPLWYKKEKGKVVDGATPWLYSKLIVSKKHNKILTNFYDNEDEKVEAYSLKDRYCTARAAIKFESIFIGNNVSLQVKLYECDVTMLDTGMPRLLSRPKANSRVLAQTPVQTSVSQIPFDDDYDSGSLGESSDEDVVEKVPVPAEDKPKKRIIRKVVKKTS